METAAGRSRTVLAESADFGGLRRRIIGQQTPMTLHEPAGACKGQVLIVPGWSGPRSGPADLLVYLATQLAQAGWRVWRLDLPGRGDACGDFNACDLDTMIQTAASSRAQSEPNAPTYLLGLCSGGNVALGTVSLDAAALRSTGVVAISTLPFQPARSAGFERRRRWRNLKQYAAKLFSTRSWLRLIRGEINLERVKKNVTASEKPRDGERNLKDSARDIEKELLAWKGPALFVWGGGDEESVLAQAHFAKLHTAGMGAPARTRFHVIAGANHNYYAQAWREELSRELLSFLSA